MVLEGIVGGLLGGVMRLAPEVIKFFTRKDDNKHELEMLKTQLEFEKTKGELKIEERYVDYGIAELGAISEAYKEQATAVANSSKWVTNASAMVRPAITYVIFGLYVAFKISLIVAGLSTGQTWITVFGAWTEADMAMLNMILGFWFLGRSIEKYKK